MSFWRLVHNLTSQIQDGVEERKIRLAERTRAGLSTRANDSVCREAIAAVENIFLQVREKDNFVLCNDAGRPTYYSKQFREKYPNGAAATMAWVEVSPHDPLKRVNMGEDGCWYYQADMW